VSHFDKLFVPIYNKPPQEENLSKKLINEIHYQIVNDINFETVLIDYKEMSKQVLDIDMNS
jgi:hypothetical protein